MKFLPFFGLQYHNDLIFHEKEVVVQKINDNASFSFSFLLLLISSSIICTLGLLLNSAPVVIGGMIISPMMWPLAKTAVGISNGQPAYIRNAIVLLIFAILITFITAAVITYISPLKSLTTQILARTTPTLLDLIIALVAGSVASLAITQPKISESLAGVAIATSLMPPICVSGIGLALLNDQTLIGGFLLFLANAVAIIFVAVVIFSSIGIKRSTHLTVRRNGAYVLISLIIVLSIPLYFYLKSYTFKAEAYQKTQAILQKDFEQISPSISVNDIVTNLSNANGGTLSVQAQVFLPQNMSINYDQQQKIIYDLQTALHKQIDLNLTIQQTITILDEQDIHNAKIKQSMQQTVIDELNKLNPQVSLDTLVMNQQDNKWTVTATTHADPSVIVTQEDRKNIEDALKKIANQNVYFDLVITPLIRLQSNKSLENEKISREVQYSLSSIIDPVFISAVRIIPIENDTDRPSPTTIMVDLKVPPGYKLPDAQITILKNQLEREYKKNFTIQVNIINQQSTSY